MQCADMHNKTSKCKQKDVGTALNSLQRRFHCLLSPQIQDTVGALHLEKDDRMRGGTAHLSSKPFLQGSNTNLDELSSVVSSVDYSPSILKEALLSDSCSNHEQEPVEKLHQQNCLSIWKNLGSWHPQESTKPKFETLAVDLGVGSIQGVGTMQGYGRVLAETVTCEFDTCASISPTWRCFTFEEITSATNSFHPDNIVGKGGYAQVYKGTLVDGQMIAIKRLTQSGAEEQREKEFLVEIGIMAHVCHPNTTPLLGFCLEGGLHLIYKFYPNGSLANFLHGTRVKSFDWPFRYKVAVGTARGLHYLHEHCRRRIIHRDIKASNILLDAEFEPQISDFGLAKWLPAQWTHHSVTPVEGTFGYLAPEYFMHGIVDEKTDVYSFGLLLLELISGRRPADDMQHSLVIWARPFLESRNVQELADPGLRGMYDYNQMHSMVVAAAMCVRQSSISRPFMSQVLELLTVGHSSRTPQNWRLGVSSCEDAGRLWKCNCENGDHQRNVRS